MTGGAAAQAGAPPRRANLFVRALRLPFAIRENPVFMRQITVHLGGTKFGLVFLFINAAMIIATVSTIGSGLADGSLPRAYSGLGLGAFLRPIYACVAYGCLAILVPLRVAGMWEGTRMDRSFDQVVATGIRPGKLHRGNWAQAMAYTAVLLVVTLPYQAFAHALGGASVPEIARDYGLLFAYANVMAVVTMAMAVARTEFVAGPSAMILFLALGFLSFPPLPSAIAHWTPIRYFIQTGFPWFTTGFAAQLYGPPVLFYLNVPDLACLAALWLLFSLGAVIYLSLGPRHTFVPGLNNFGNVVLPGDRRRSRLRTLRFALNRRVEMAFLYENRPRGWAAWDWPLRTGVLLLFALAFWTLLIGFQFQKPPIIPWGAPQLEGLQVYVLIVGGLVLGVTLFAYGESRESFHGRERVGPLVLPRSLLAFSYFAIALGGFLSFSYLPLASALADEVAASQAASPPLGVVLSALRERLGIVALFALNLWLFGRLIARKTETPRGTRGFLLLVAVVIVLLPLVLVPFYEEGLLRSPDLAGVTFVSPLAALLDSFRPEDSPMRKVLAAGAGLRCYWTFGAALFAFQALVIVLLSLVRQGRRRRPAEPAAAAARAAVTVLAMILARSLSGAGVTAEVVRGFDRHAYSRFEHFTVVLSRDLPAGVEDRGSALWELSIETPDGLPYVLPRKVEVPPGTRTVVRCVAENLPQNMYMGPYSPVKLILRSGSVRQEIDVPESTAADPDSVKFLMVSEGGKTPSLSVSGHQWVGCQSEWLPERPEAYLGVDFVLMGPLDLGGWTPGQRRALLDFARLGGTVVFFGGLDPKVLAAAPEWAEHLEPAEPPRTEVREISFRLHPLAGSRVVWTAGEDPALPVLWLRSLGLGHVGFLAVNPLVSGPVSHLGGAEGFWKRFVSVTPAGLPSELPIVLSQTMRKPGGGRSLLVVTLYFAAYAFLLGPAMIVFFRARRRRFWAWAIAPAISLIFTFGSPFLFLAMEAEPSGGRELTFTFYGAAGGEGVRLSEVNIHSSGRQRHRLTFLGEDLTVFGDADRESSLLATASGSAPLRLDVPVMPWGSRKVLAVSRERAAPPPVRGRFAAKPKNGAWLCEVEGLRPGTEAKVVIVPGMSSEPSAPGYTVRTGAPFPQQIWHNISSWINPRGPAKGSVPFNSTEWGWGSTGFTRYFRLNGNLQPPRARAFVVWQNEAAPKGVESPDLDLDPGEDRQAFVFRELEMEDVPEENKAAKER